MKAFKDENELAAALSELRPTPRPEFSAELDARAAAGFPRDSRWGVAVMRFRERLTSTPPRRLLAPACAFAVVAVVVATALVTATESDGPTSGDRQTAIVEPTPAESTVGESTATDNAESGSQGIQFEAPTAASGSAKVVPGRSTGPYASGAAHRDIERSAEIVIGADPAAVRSDAAAVFDAVHAVRGIVLSSSIRDGEAGEAGADFELLIPSDKVGDAMASISSIAEVRSRHEATQDITAPTVSVAEMLQDTRARVESLLGQLVEADTDEERAAVEAQLRSERHRVAKLRSRLSSLNRRANLSHVSVRIETGASSGHEGGGGGWGLGNGLDDAGRILAIAAGVTVIGLAILTPFALIALLTLLTRRAWLRRARRDALSRA